MVLYAESNSKSTKRKIAFFVLSNLLFSNINYTSTVAKRATVLVLLCLFADYSAASSAFDSVAVVSAASALGVALRRLRRVAFFASLLSLSIASL